MKKLFLSTLLLVLPLLASAFIGDAEVDGIWYNIITKGKVATVISHRNGSYSGDIVIPSSISYEGVVCDVTSIGEGAFSGCTGLTSITIPNSIISIGGYAFHNCSGLQKVIVKDLAAWCSISFSNYYLHYESVNPLYYAHHLYSDENTEIIDLVIPNSVTNITGRAFSGCNNFNSVTIPNSVISIGADAFYGCNGLKKVFINDLATWCTMSFSSYNSNPLYYAHHLYLNGEEIKDLVIPNSVTSIGDYAFYTCSELISLTIPNSVTSIGEKAFSYCEKLEEVYCYAEKLPSTTSNPFEYTYQQYVTLYVPASALSRYKWNTPWDMFGTIKSIESDDKKCATPTISYNDKILTFNCDTEGATCHYTISDSDINSGAANEVSLSATYNISVYATKSGYTNSDVATATLVWTDAVFTETTPSTSSAKAIAESIPMLISAQNGTITVRGEQNGLPLAVYTADGKMLGSATIKDGQASISTNLQRGEIAIVKVGSKSVKVKM